MLSQIDQNNEEEVQAPVVTAPSIQIKTSNKNKGKQNKKQPAKKQPQKQPQQQQPKVSAPPAKTTITTTVTQKGMIFLLFYIQVCQQCLCA
jgi:hypothetical protein